MGNYRINPTLNGPMHIGHLGLALFNESMAHAEGGKFIFRGEDNQASWLLLHTLEEMQDIGMQWLAELSLLGVHVDSIYFESDVERDGEIARIIHKYYPNAVDNGNMPYVPQMAGSCVTYYPYALYLTAKTVLMDYMNGISTVLVGEDLMSRADFYYHLCEVFGIPNPPRYLCIPRLKLSETHDELSQVSKTNGSFSIQSLMQSNEPRDIVKFVASNYLKDVKAGWNLDNLNPNPVIYYVSKA